MAIDMPPADREPDYHLLDADPRPLSDTAREQNEWRRVNAQLNSMSARPTYVMAHRGMDDSEREDNKNQKQENYSNSERSSSNHSNNNNNSDHTFNNYYNNEDSKSTNQYYDDDCNKSYNSSNCHKNTKDNHQPTRTNATKNQLQLQHKLQQPLKKLRSAPAAPS
ncbi:MAG: hypothetical protein Q9178_002670 [Gyalolechia marmorata]